MGKDFLLNERPLQVTVGRRRMRAVDGTGDRAFSDGSSRYAGIAHTGGAAHQTVEPQHRNRGISHVWSSCMRITPALSLLPEEKTVFAVPNFNRISLPIPKLPLLDLPPDHGCAVRYVAQCASLAVQAGAW